MDHHVGLCQLEQFRHEAIIGEIADANGNLLAGMFLEYLAANMKIGIGHQRFGGSFQSHLTAKVIVCDPDLMALRREMHRRRPAEISVAAQDKYARCH